MFGSARLSPFCEMRIMEEMTTREEFSARIKAGEEIPLEELECADLTQEERAELLRESIVADIARNGGKSRFIDLGDGRFALRSLLN